MLRQSSVVVELVTDTHASKVKRTVGLSAAECGIWMYPLEVGYPGDERSQAVNGCARELADPTNNSTMTPNARWTLRLMDESPVGPRSNGSRHRQLQLYQAAPRRLRQVTEPVDQAVELVAVGGHRVEQVVVDQARVRLLDPDLDLGDCEADDGGPQVAVRPGTDDAEEDLGASGERAAHAERLGDAAVLLHPRDDVGAGGDPHLELEAGDGRGGQPRTARRGGMAREREDSQDGTVESSHHVLAGAVQRPDRYQARLRRGEGDAPQAVDLRRRAGHAPQAHFVDGAGRRALPGNVAADPERAGARGRRTRLGEGGGEHAVDVVVPRDAIRRHGDVCPDAPRDDATVLRRAAPPQVGPESGLAGDVTLADPPGLDIVLAGDGPAILAGGAVRNGDPGFEGEAARRVERRMAGDLDVAVRRRISRRKDQPGAERSSRLRAPHSQNETETDEQHPKDHASHRDLPNPFERTVKPTDSARTYLQESILSDAALSRSHRRLRTAECYTEASAVDVLRFTGHRHEADGQHFLAVEGPVGALGEDLEVLPDLPHRQHEPAAGFDLAEERLRHVRRCRGDDDGVERSMLRPPLVAVADADLDVAIALLSEGGARLRTERRDDLHAIDLAVRADDLGEDRGLISRSGADLEHLVARTDAEELGHPRHHVGLGDGLPLADGERRILVRRSALRRGHEQVARHLLHGREHPGVGDAALADLLLHHQVAHLALAVRSAHVPRQGRQEERQQQAGDHPLTRHRAPCPSWASGGRGSPCASRSRPRSW